MYFFCWQTGSLESVDFIRLLTVWPIELTRRTLSCFHCFPFSVFLAFYCCQPALLSAKFNTSLTAFLAQV